jgi:hypothetical protein
LVTVIDAVVAPLLQSREAVTLSTVNTELPQLFATLTEGVGGVALTVNVAAFEFAVPTPLVHTARYCFELSLTEAVKVNEAFTAPLRSVHVFPSVLTCHCTIGAGVPVAADVKVTFVPEQTVSDVG